MGLIVTERLESAAPSCPGRTARSCGGSPAVCAFLRTGPWRRSSGTSGPGTNGLERVRPRSSRIPRPVGARSCGRRTSRARAILPGTGNCGCGRSSGGGDGRRPVHPAILRRRPRVHGVTGACTNAEDRRPGGSYRWEAPLRATTISTSSASPGSVIDPRRHASVQRWRGTRSATC